MDDVLASHEAWLCERLTHFLDLRSEPFAPRIKALDELCLYAWLSRAQNASSAPLADRLATELKNVDLSHWLDAEPGHALAFVFPTVFLAEQGTVSPGFASTKQRLVERLCDTSVWSVQRPIHRILDLLFSLELLTGRDFESEIACITQFSMIHFPPVPSSGTCSDFYAFTHCIFFASRFGRRPLKASATIRRAIFSGVLRFLFERNADLICELILCLYYLDGTQVEVELRDALFPLLLLFLDKGIVEAPALHHDVLAEFSDGPSREWYKNYHTVLVLCVLIRTRAAQPRYDCSGVPHPLLDASIGDLAQMGHELQQGELSARTINFIEDCLKTGRA